MSTVSRGLPAQPHLHVPKHQARHLLQQCKQGSTDAFDRVRRRHPKFHSAADDTILTQVKLSDAQLVIAREYGFSSWTQLKQRITGNTAAQLIDKAIRANDTEAVAQLLTAYPDLLHIPLVSGNWGPPMSHAANLGLLDMVKTIDIYPLELGCHDDQISGLHGTPIDGTTLLHLSIDFDEQEIFDWLIEKGADVNAPALVGSEGFGGHTPLFNVIVSDAYVNGRQRDGYMARRLLDLGADINVKVNLRKYLDWREEPGWHIARNVTPLEWAADFPEKGWVSREAVDMISRLQD